MEPREPRGPRGAPSYVIWYWVVRAMLPALAVVGIPAVAGFLASDYFALRQVIVRSDDPEVAWQAASALEIAAGTNTVFCRPTAIAKQVIDCPRVLQATVDRDLPATLIVTVTKREPLFALEDASGYVLVDAAGILLLHSAVPRPGQPVVQGLATADYEVGGQLSSDCLNAVRACMAGAREGELGLDFTLDLRTRYDYKLQTPSGLLVKLGGPDNLLWKVTVAAEIERHFAERDKPLEYVDVRLPGQPPNYKLRDERA